MIIFKAYYQNFLTNNGHFSTKERHLMASFDNKFRHFDSKLLSFWWQIINILHFKVKLLSFLCNIIYWQFDCKLFWKQFIIILITKLNFLINGSYTVDNLKNVNNISILMVNYWHFDGKFLSFWWKIIDISMQIIYILVKNGRRFYFFM